MKEGLTALQDMEGRLGAFEVMLDSEVPANEQMDFALHFLGWLENESKAAADPFQADILSLMAKVTEATSPFDQAVGRVKNAIQSLLEKHPIFFPDQRHDSEVGRAQMVRPKNRIIYDIKGLETLRKSSDEVARLIGHLRDEKPSTPYLKIKVK